MFLGNPILVDNSVLMNDKRTTECKMKTQEKHSLQFKNVIDDF